MRTRHIISVALVCIALAGCGGGGGGGSSSSGDGGGGGTILTTGDLNDRIGMLVSSEEIGPRLFSAGGGFDDLTRTDESGATWTVSGTGTLVATATQPDADADGSNDTHTMSATASSGSVSTLTGTYRITFQPGDVQTVSATMYRLPAVNSTGTVDATATIWEDQAGARYTIPAGPGSGAITSSTRTGFTSGTYIATTSYVYLSFDYTEAATAKLGHIVGVKNAASGTALAGVSVLGTYAAPVVSTAATLTAVPVGGG